MGRLQRIGVSPSPSTDGWNVFAADGTLIGQYDDRREAERIARTLGWSPARKRRMHVPWGGPEADGNHPEGPVAAALRAWRDAEAHAEAQDPGCDPRERDAARLAVKRARAAWEAAVEADRRKLF
jgi:hypothetical protein